MRGVGKFFPCVFRRVIFIEPRHVSIPVTVLYSAHDVDLVSVNKHTCCASSSICGNLGSHTPFIILRIENVNVRDRSLMRISTSKGAQYPHFIFVCNGLEVMHLQWCFSQLCPFLCLEIKR